MTSHLMQTGYSFAHAEAGDGMFVCAQVTALWTLIDTIYNRHHTEFVNDNHIDMFYVYHRHNNND